MPSFMREIVSTPQDSNHLFEQLESFFRTGRLAWKRKVGYKGFKEVGIPSGCSPPLDRGPHLCSRSPGLSNTWDGLEDVILMVES
jgi:hypothetical protein